MFFKLAVIVFGAFIAQQAEGLRTRQFCEYETMKLQCLEGQRISIYSASFGRKNTVYCNNNMWTSQRTNCTGLAASFNAVSKKCNNRRACAMEVSTTHLGDPCPAISKYLDIAYDCVEGNLLTKVACEEETLTITCSSNKKITINEATFGRTKPVPCFRYGTYTSTLTCSANGTTAIVINRCDGKQKCQVPASSQLFGDPCSGYNKYLEVKYVCV